MYACIYFLKKSNTTQTRSCLHVGLNLDTFDFIFFFKNSGVFISCSKSGPIYQMKRKIVKFFLLKILVKKNLLYFSKNWTEEIFLGIILGLLKTKSEKNIYFFIIHVAGRLNNAGANDFQFHSHI